MAIIEKMEYRKKIIDYLQTHRLMRHLLFWVVIFITYIPLGMLDNDTFPVTMIMNACLHIPQMMAAYFFAYFLIPKFVFKKRYVMACLLAALALYLFPMLARILTVHVGEELVRPRPFEQESIQEIMTDLGKLCFNYLPVVYTVSFQFLFVKYFLDYKRSKDKEILLSKQKTEAELKTLKAQLNPHFLFNTLNNIYSLSLYNSPKTPQAIGKLSEILDHILYKCNEEKVGLSSEINLLRNYIELEKLRYDERLEVTLVADVQREIQLPPLILLSLVENAFKHGAGEDSGSPKIDIQIESHPKFFRAQISNTVSGDYMVKEERIGLSNIRKQLDLVYEDRYAMETQCTSGSFKVVLKINTDGHEN
ncbi:sensor histidine kinase [Flavobacterium sp.]|uniref:sensor histidine kinase n=1 Tax=Flavobacterium sp. TaxID=239 RepID=UPI0039E5F3CF